MRTLAPFLKNYKKESILAPFFKFLEVVFDLLVPVVIARIIDVGIARDDRGFIIQNFLILILMAAAGLTVSITAQYFAAKASVGFATELRQAVYDHVQGLSYTELDRLGTDTLITRLTDDINQVQNGLNMGLRLLLRSPFIVIGSMVMAFTINVRCALIFAAAIPVLFLVVFVIMYLSIPLFGRVQGKLDAVTGLTRENLTGVRVIRAFCREKEAVEEFDQSNLALTKLNEFVGRLSALLNPVTYVLINIATVILINNAGLQVSLGNMQQGEVVALYNYMAQMIVELIKLASLIITLNKSAACAGRVADILKVDSTMEFAGSSSGDSTGSRSVEFQNVTFSYQGTGAPSLTDISFSVKKGETVGIIGGTGSGKSTLVNLIARFYDATSGEILLDGENIRNYSRRALRDKIGVVPQRAALFKGSIRDNMKWGREDATDEEIWSALTTAQAREIVEGKPGQLDFALEQNGKNLSGGQRQRLTIARALVKNPEILILDDSASALDFATDAALRKALAGLGGQVTTFLVSQRAASIRQADQILVLDDGALCGLGTHDTLIRSCSTYREIYFSQFPEERNRYENGEKISGRQDGTPVISGKEVLS
ncbi:MAG TPA: ABC transporter ATP-binding protein/permease [Candidatus Blautia excrementigallinarum]|nr:ABC transporter ATP-binding protein/permease [Candidatus Blautia excrementigallinarum]